MSSAPLEHPPQPKPSATDVTVIIPTLDEELHIQRAVEGALKLGPVWVVDSGSSDRTVRLAQEAGAMVVQQHWLGHAAQKNWALDNLPLATTWIMFLDADEYIPTELATEVRAVVSVDAQAVAYYVARRNIFLGRELRHVWWYPDYQLRLFKLGKARYEDREVHEHMVAAGPVERLRAALVHENLKGIDAFLERHVRYAQAEARAIAQSDRAPAALPSARAAVRRWIKTHLWYRLSHRPALRFVWLYVVRRGFLDGPQGRIYAQLISAYESMIDGFVLEAKLSHDAGGDATAT